MSTTFPSPPTSVLHVTDACASVAIAPGLGVVALVDGQQVAILRDDAGDLHAIDNRDPCTGAFVLSRGLVGDVDGRTIVASPLRKHRFDLLTGACLDDPTARVTVHEVAEVDGRVLVRLAPLR